jgi:hypothetical protein
MKQENREEKKRRRDRNYVSDEVQFDHWYSEIKTDLVDSSHSKYQSVKQHVVLDPTDQVGYIEIN